MFFYSMCGVKTFQTHDYFITISCVIAIFSNSNVSYVLKLFGVKSTINRAFSIKVQAKQMTRPTEVNK